MNHDRLRLDLADLAAEVTPVDLRDRALRTSRRLGIQRAVTTSAAVLALVAAAAGTAFAVLPRADGPAPLPADPPSVTVPPSPPTSPTPTATGSSTPPPDSADTRTETPTIGRLHYGPDSGSVAGSTRLQSWRPATKPEPLLSLSKKAALTNATVSPDGRSVAWVEQGTLYVARIDGSGRRELRSEVDDLCMSPAWSPDSRQLLIASRNTEGGVTGLVEVSSRRFVQVAGISGCHPVWAAGGTVAIADGADGTIVLTDADGGNRRIIPGLGKDQEYVSFNLSSVSPDGRLIALFRMDRDGTWGDAARYLRANVVLNTRTGAEVDLDLGGRELRQAYFQADGTLVARVESGGRFVLVLLDADGKKISETPEPAALKGMQILAVTG